MPVNWVRVYNRLFELINANGDTYFSGPRFIGKVREVDQYFPDYGQYPTQRRASCKSTSRKEYFYDILLGFAEPERLRILNGILDEVRQAFPNEVAAIQDELGGVSAVPPVRIDTETWNGDRLNRYLEEIDVRIGATNYEGALTLAYTCLEGFLKAFAQQNIPSCAECNDIIELSRAVKGYLRNTVRQYPDEALSMLTHVAHTVDRARNRFSESHFDQEADRWLAVFVRDLVNAEIRLLLEFMSG